AFPTGDMFRRLEVRARAVGPGPDAIAKPAVLGRTFIDVPRSENELGFVRVEAEDHRVAPPGGAPRTVMLDLPDPARDRASHYEVAYQRMGAPMARAFGVNQVLDEIIVAEGELLPRGVSGGPHSEGDTP